MKNAKKSWVGILVAGMLTAAIVAGAGLLFMNPPQCPANYTQAQVDTSNCIIGANIGLGLMLMLAVVIVCVTIALAIGVALTKRQAPR